MKRYFNPDVDVDTFHDKILLIVDKFYLPKQFPLRDASTKAFGRLLLHLVQSDPSNTSTHLDCILCLVSALHDDSSEVRRRALSSLKAVSKVCNVNFSAQWIRDFLGCSNLLQIVWQANPSVIAGHANVIGPAIGECLKDGSTPVRLAAERCALHIFQLTKGNFFCFCYSIYCFVLPFAV